MSNINIPEGRSLHPFLFMGCWNKEGKPRNTVAAAIQEDDVETLILGGDNIYPEKIVRANGSKNSTYHLALLDDGLTRLDKKTIYAALGNHNIVDPDVAAYELELPWILPGSYYSLEFADKYAIIVLNTNLIANPEFTDMMLWFSETQRELQGKGIPYYLIQHEPFVSFKKEKIQMLLRGHDILEAITYPPIAILCADTHNYQKGPLTYKDRFTVDQIVVGTGGAHYDKVTVPIGTVHEANDIRYVLAEHVPGFGYLRVNVGNTEFRKVADWSMQEGGRRARKTRHRIKRNRKTRKHR